jgi:FKBP-type peptidyl-prolyl cis-trans isomerase SlyD
MNAGDFIYIDYVGKIKDTGDIFDLTNEEMAKKENMFKPDFKYGPVPVIVDTNFVLPGLNDALREMKVGDKRVVDIAPDKAFGQKNPDLIKMVPESVFKDHNQNPAPGAFVTVNRLKGRIISNDGGRVRIDFNHPLAGKMLQYDLEIKGEITDTVEKVKAISYFFTALSKEDLDAAVNGKEAEITLKTATEVHRESKATIAETIIKWVKGVEKVKFVEVFEK